MFSKDYIAQYKKTFLLAYPVVISQVGHITVSLADSIMVGRIGTIPLAACAFASSLFTLFLVSGIGISYGLTPLVAQENGRKNYSACAALLEQGLFINMAAGIILFTIIFFISPLLTALGQAPEVLKEALPFFNIIGFSLVPLMIFMSFKQFAEGLGFTRQAMYISIAANVLNVGLSYLLIYGNWGFPRMGLTGAGWANFIARLFMAVLMCWYVLKASPFKKYLKSLHLRNINFPMMRNILKIGLPTALQYVFEISAFSGAAVMVGWIGAQKLAAHQIAMSLAAITYMASSGISSAATVRVGNAYGESNFKQMRLAGFSSYYIVIFFMALSGCLFILLNHILPQFYVNDPGVISLASSLLIIAAFFQISDGVQVVGLGALRGMGDVKIPAIITLFAYWIFALPLGYFFGFRLGLGVEGVWYGLLTGLSLAAILLFSRFYYFTERMIRN